MDIESGIDVSSPEGLEDWLQDKFPDWAAAIVTRAALRVLPVSFSLLGAPKEPASADDEKRSLLMVLRTMFVSWAACRYSVNDAVRVSARVAAEAADAGLIMRVPQPETLAGRSVALGARVASFVAQWERDASRTGSTIVQSVSPCARAFDIFQDFDGSARRDIWSAVSADVKWLDANQSGRLIDRPLWLIDVRGDSQYQANFPIWAREPFDRFDEYVRSRNRPWAVWLRWYRAILPNSSRAQPHSSFGEENDIWIATQDDKFWDRDPAQAGDHPGPTAGYTTSWDTTRIRKRVGYDATSMARRSNGCVPSCRRQAATC